MEALIGVKLRDRRNLRVIQEITTHKFTKCVDFAYKLLVDEQPVRKLCNEHDKKEKEEFVRGVLQKWLNRDDDKSERYHVPGLVFARRLRMQALTGSPEGES